MTRVTHPCLSMPSVSRETHVDSRRRNLGGRYCLVCSLVARSAKSSSKSKSNISARGSHASPSRETRALLGSGTGSARVMGAGCGHRESPTGSVGVASSVGISRLKGGERGQGSPIAGGVGRIGVMGGRQKDGVFFRPLPKARSGSWGGAYCLCDTVLYRVVLLLVVLVCGRCDYVYWIIFKSL